MAGFAHILLVAGRHEHDVRESPLLTFRRCKRPLDSVIVSDCMDAVVLLPIADADPAEHIVDKSLDEAGHVDLVDLAVDACQFAVEPAVVDCAYSALVGRAACSCSEVAVDLAAVVRRTAYSAASEHCSVAGLAAAVAS